MLKVPNWSPHRHTIPCDLAHSAQQKSNPRAVTLRIANLCSAFFRVTTSANLKALKVVDLLHLDALYFTLNGSLKNCLAQLLSMQH